MLSMLMIKLDSFGDSPSLSLILKDKGLVYASRSEIDGRHSQWVDVSNRGIFGNETPDYVIGYVKGRDPSSFAICPIKDYSPIFANASSTRNVDLNPRKVISIDEHFNEDLGF